MENYNQPPTNQFNDMPYKLPNATLSLILSLSSFLICCFLGLGIITSAIALFLVKKDAKLLQLNANVSNLNIHKAAQVIAWITLIINIIYLIYTIWLFNLIGFENLMNPEVLKDPEFIEELMRKNN